MEHSLSANATSLLYCIGGYKLFLDVKKHGIKIHCHGRDNQGSVSTSATTKIPKDRSHIDLCSGRIGSMKELFTSGGVNDSIYITTNEPLTEEHVAPFAPIKAPRTNLSPTSPADLVSRFDDSDWFVVDYDETEYVLV